MNVTGRRRVSACVGTIETIDKSEMGIHTRTVVLFQVEIEAGRCMRSTFGLKLKSATLLSQM
jgi:hypothetical protein